MSANGPILPKLKETSRLLKELSCEAEGLAKQLDDLQDGNIQGALNEKTICSLSDAVARIKSEFSQTARLEPLLGYKIPWVEDKRDYLPLMYVKGDDPWEFYLAYKDDQEQLRKIKDSIAEKSSKGLLVNCPPKVGEFAVCHKKCNGQEDIFRAVVTSFPCNPAAPLPRRGLRSICVYDIDTGNHTCVFPQELYYVPEDLASVPSRFIKCCLDVVVGEDHLKELFSSSLRGLVQRFLENSVLTVNVLDKIDNSVPPCFSTQVWGWNEDNGRSDVILNRFIGGKLIPVLKDVPPDCPDVYRFAVERNAFDGWWQFEKTRKPEGDNLGYSRQRSAVNSSDLAMTQSDSFYDPDSIEKVADWISKDGQPGCYSRIIERPPRLVEPTFDMTLTVPMRPQLSAQEKPKQAQARVQSTVDDFSYHGVDTTSKPSVVPQQNLEKWEKCQNLDWNSKNIVGKASLPLSSEDNMNQVSQYSTTKSAVKSPCFQAVETRPKLQEEPKNLLKDFKISCSDLIASFINPRNRRSKPLNSFRA